MKISFLVFLVSAILLALFAPTNEALGRIPSLRKTNLNSFRNSLRRTNLRKIARPDQPAQARSARRFTGNTGYPYAITQGKLGN